MIASSPLDPQAIGWKDDGTDGGVIRTEVARGGLVFQSFNLLDQARVIVSGGTTACTLNLGTPSISFGAFSHSCLFCKVHPTVGSLLTVRFYFRGKRLWLALGTLDSVSHAQTTVFVDGQAYQLPLCPVDPLTNAKIIHNERCLAYKVSDDFDDGIHSCSVTFHGTTAATLTNYMYGYYVDAATGARPPEPTVFAVGPAVVTAVATRATINSLTGSNANFIAAVDSVCIANTSAGTVVVALDINNVVYWQDTLLAKKSVLVPFGNSAPLCVSSNLVGITADTGSAVNVTMFCKGF